MPSYSPGVEGVAWPLPSPSAPHGTSQPKSVLLEKLAIRRGDNSAKVVKTSSAFKTTLQTANN